MVDEPNNLCGYVSDGPPCDLGLLKHAADALRMVQESMEPKMSGRDDREATTERELRDRDAAEGKAWVLDAEREAEQDEQSLSDYAKRRITDLEEERDAYRDCLKSIARTLHNARWIITETLRQHQENPDDK